MGNLLPERIVYLPKHLIFSMGYYRGENLHWRVLASKGDAFLVISENVISLGGFIFEVDNKPFINSLEWLNTAFFSSAFSNTEQHQIIDTYFDDWNRSFKVWSLSSEEANALFASDPDRIAFPSGTVMDDTAFQNYCCDNDNRIAWALIDTYEKCHEEDEDFYYVCEDGSLSYDSKEFIWFIGMRPAMWVKKECVPFQLPDHCRFFFAKQIGVYKGEKLTWIELAKEENRHLLLCNYIVEYLPFNTEYAATQWKDSSIRHWLNDDFFNQAFNSSEQKGIVEHQTHTDYEGQHTDKVFLLSVEESRKYLDFDHWCSFPFHIIPQLFGPATYLSPQHIGRYIGLRRRDVWILRSNAEYGNNLYEVANIIESTDIYSNKSNHRELNDGGRNLNVNCIAGIRPAIWICE